MIEVLLVIALLALLAGTVAGNLGAFLKGANFEPPDRVLKKAVLDAVYFSSERKRSTYLSYYEDNATFLVSDSMGIVLAEHRIYKEINEEIAGNRENFPKVRFWGIGPLSGVEGDESQYERDQMKLTRVRFHAGSSVPFGAEIEFGEREKEMFFDPFSGYVLKGEE